MSWKLVGSLISKHVSVLGDHLSQGIASFDPETATKVDRDNLQARLREIALKKADARQKYDTAQKRADDLAALIASDERDSAILIGKFEKEEIDEATLTEFANNLEAQKSRLPGLQQDAADAKQLLDTLQEILNTVEQNLADFDSRAQQATRNLEQAKADHLREDLRIQNQAELSRLSSGVGASSTGLNALDRAAQRERVEADGAKTVADIGQKPIDRSNAVDEARRIAAGTEPAKTESAADRLRRIAAAGK